VTYKQAIAAGAFGFALLVALAMVLAIAYAPPVPVSKPTIVFEKTQHEPVKRPPVSSTVK
jgi:hypothetical protein